MVYGSQLGKTNRRENIGLSTTGPMGGLTGVTAGRDDRRVAGVCPAGATRRESRRYLLGASLAGWLYYTTLISSKILLQRPE